MSEILHSTIDVRPLGTGRRIFALEKTRPIAEEAGLGGVVTRIDGALGEEKKTWAMELAWQASRGQSTARGNAFAVDVEIDRTLKALFDTLDAASRGLPGSKSAENATVLRDALFPKGLQPVLQQPFEDSRLYLRTANERFTGDLKKLLKDTGTTEYAERIVELTARFEVELDQLAAVPEVSFQELRAARDRGNLRLKQIVVAILAETLELDPAAEKARARLLAPLHDQERRAAEARRRRKVEVDIDPATGDELDGATAVEPVEG